MFIYLLLLIPAITAGILFYLFKTKMSVWEYAIIFSTSLFFIFLSKIIIEKINVNDVEIWGEYATKVYYYEAWDEYIHQTCSRQVPCGTDSKGNTQYCTEFYDCSYVAQHPEYWQSCTNIGNCYNINKGQYNYYKNKWQNNNFLEMNRNYHSYDGDAYFSNYNGDMEYLLSYFNEHRFENRVVASHSLFKTQDVDTNYYKGLFSYPVIIGDQVGSYFADKKLFSESFYKGNKELTSYNALLGSDYKIRMSVIFFLNKEKEWATQQRFLWKNGKKNELIVCLGVDDALNVKWVDFITWSESELLKVNLRNGILDMKKIDFHSLNNLIVENVKKDWKRKDFKEFNYLTVDPTTGQFFIVLFLILFLNGVMGYFSATNSFNSEIHEEAIELEVLFKLPLTVVVGKPFSLKGKALGFVRSISENRLNLVTYKPEDVSIVSRELSNLGHRFYTVSWVLSKVQIDNESIKRNF